MEHEYARKYEDILLPEELMEYYVYLLRQPRFGKNQQEINAFQVLKLIASETPAAENTNKYAKGILLFSIMKELTITQHVASQILQLLIGMTLICCKPTRGSGSLWMLTQRGIQVLAYITDKGLSKTFM